LAENPKPGDIKERTFNFAVAIVRLCAELSERPGVSRNLSYQLLNSATSIGANVEEAQAGQSRADFVSKYGIALKEARETIYWLRLLEASGQLSGEKVQTLRREAEEISRIIGAIIVHAKSNNARK
jgi:four helix bundle protein